MEWVLWIWFIANLVNFGILGRFLRIDMLESEGEPIGVDAYSGLAIASLVFGPLMTAWFIGFLYKGR